MRALLHRKSRRFVAAAVAVALALGAVSAASAAEREWFFGTTVHSTSVDIAYGYYDSKTGPSNTGYAVHGGLQINRYLAVDLGLQRNSDLRWAESLASTSYGPGTGDFHVEFDASVTQATVVGRWPFGDVFDVYGRVGIGAYQLEGEKWLTDSTGSSSSPQPTSSHGTGALIGLGVGATVAKNWRLSFEFQTVFVGKAFFGVPATHGFLPEEQNDAYLDSLTFGIERHFGGGNRGHELR
jgi:opacity protein-like surface antigen